MFKRLKRAWQLLDLATYEQEPKQEFTKEWQIRILEQGRKLDAVSADTQRIMYHGHFVESSSPAGTGHLFGLCVDGTVWERHVSLFSGTDTGWTQVHTTPEIVKMTPKQFVEKYRA